MLIDLHGNGIAAGCTQEGYQHPSILAFGTDTIAQITELEDNSAIILSTTDERADPTVTTFLYDMAGNWIAFRTAYDGKYLFDTTGEWIGWFPWDDNDAVDRDGNYLGTVIDNRLLQRLDHGYRTNPGYPGAPAFPGHIGFPGSTGYYGGLPGYADVPLSQLAA